MVGPGAPFDGTGEELTIESVLDPLPVNDRPAIRVRIVPWRPDRAGVTVPPRAFQRRR